MLALNAKASSTETTVLSSRASHTIFVTEEMNEKEFLLNNVH